jgi:purine nucleosidase
VTSPTLHCRAQTHQLRPGAATYLLGLLLSLVPPCLCRPLSAQSPAAPPAPQLVLFDTDIGDDIDDVLALGLALSSPELKIVGITASWGDTTLRARLVDRLLSQSGHADVPVAIGPVKHHAGEGVFSQAAWASRQPARDYPDAVDFLLSTVHQHSDVVTLIAVAPLTTIAAAFDRDPATFRHLHRIILMGGSVHRGYGDLGYTPGHGPDAEYNIAMDPEAARKVFTSGVPFFVMPLDSTQIPLDEAKRRLLFTASTPLTDALTLLYQQWSRATELITPTMFDAVAVAFAINPAVCPVEPLRLVVDVQGFTREQPGLPSAQVCLRSNTDAFFDLFMRRLLGPGQPRSLPPSHP